MSDQSISYSLYLCIDILHLFKNLQPGNYMNSSGMEKTLNGNLLKNRKRELEKSSSSIFKVISWSLPIQFHILDRKLGQKFYYFSQELKLCFPDLLEFHRINSNFKIQKLSVLLGPPLFSMLDSLDILPLLPLLTQDG